MIDIIKNRYAPISYITSKYSIFKNINSLSNSGIQGIFYIHIQKFIKSLRLTKQIKSK